MLIQGARRPLEVDDDMLEAINSALRAMKIDDQKIILDMLSFKYSVHASFLRKTVGERAPLQQRSDEGSESSEGDTQDHCGRQRGPERSTPCAPQLRICYRNTGKGPLLM